MSQVIDSIMSTPVVSVEMDDKLSLVYSLFEKTKFHHLVVVDHKELAGIISDRDVFKAFTRPLAPQRKPVRIWRF